MKQDGFIMKINKNKHPFTLLEVLVSMGVFSLLMLALMQFFSAAQGVWEKSGSKSELFDSARIASQLLTDDLTSAFYGDQDHEMGDAADKYIFYKNTGSRLTFATQRGGGKGLTEVDYNWNTTDLTLEIREISEGDTGTGAPSLGESGWVAYPSNAWITNVQGKSATPILEDVLYFNVTDSGRVDGDAHRPPPFVLVTLAVLGSAGYEKLDTIIRPGVSGSSDSEKETQVKSQIKTYFDAMLSGTKDKFKDDAVPESGSDVPAKQILLDNVQFFKLIIPIER